MHVQCVPCATTHPSLSHVNQEPVEDVHKFSSAYAPIQCCEIYLCKTTQSGFHLEGGLGKEGRDNMLPPSHEAPTPKHNHFSSAIPTP